MSVFCQKKLDPPVRVCTRLKKTREDLGLSLAELETKTHIPQKYLEAIENCAFDQLPKANVYRIAYLREYARAVGLNPKTVIYQFTREDGLGDIKNTHPHRHIKFFPFMSFSFIARNITVVVLILLFVGYLVWQIKGIIEPPKLIVYTPLEGFITSNMRVLVQGETDKECKININGQAVMANEQGQFSTNIDLTNGVNSIIIASAKKHGKTTTITRHVVAKWLDSQLDITPNN